MAESSEEIRRKIIGLGDTSVKKSYYPLLQEKIRDLEEKQKQLVELVRSLEEREVELEHALEEKTVLLREVNHRVKNNLQLISSLLSLGASSHESSEKEKFENTRKRIETLSLVYQDFLFSENLSEVTFYAFLRTITMEARSEAGMPDTKILFDFPVNEVLLPVDIAIPLALISSEVIFNVFSSDSELRSKSLSISLIPSESSDAVQRYRLSINYTDRAKVNSEYGKSLINALTYQIAGNSTYLQNGSGMSFILDFGIPY